MTIELKMLAASIILGFVQLMIAARTMTMQRGIAWNISSRDKKMPELTGLAARFERAFKNFMETFPFFAAAILMVTFVKAENDISAWGAQLYFACRLLYVFIYAAGIPIARTVVWSAASIGLFMVMSALI